MSCAQTQKFGCENGEAAIIGQELIRKMIFFIGNIGCLSAEDLPALLASVSPSPLCSGNVAVQIFRLIASTL
jgi:hypothetical protein